MAKISDVEIPSLLFGELGSDPTTPASGKWRLYTKAGGIYLIDDAGAVIGPFAAGGSVSDTVYGAGWNGDTTTAPSKNAVYDKIETLGGSSSMRGCRAYRSAALSLANNGQTAVAFDAETFDTNTLHDNSTNPSRIVLNAVGKWAVTAHLAYAGSATGVRDISILLNGTTTTAVREVPAVTGASTYINISDVVVATAITDYIEIIPFQNSGGSLGFSVGASTVYCAATFLGT